MSSLLFESDVVDAVCKYSLSMGYEIIQYLGPKQKGVDIILRRPEHPRELWIEAKGETSEREGTSRYGRPFDSAQVHIHVAEAFYTAAEHLATIPAKTDRLVGIALPSNELHRRYAGKISPILTRLGIVDLWVDSDKTVTAVPADALSLTFVDDH